MIVPQWVLALAISVPLTVALARLLWIWAPRWGLVDAANRRKSHRGDVPIGGLAVVVGSAGALGPVLGQEPALIWWVVGALAVATVGLVDDRRSLSPLWKLGIQAGAAVLALQGGLSVTGVSVVGVEFPLGAVGMPFVVLWLVGLTNAFNLTDGLDGLACGAAVLLALATVAMSLVSGDAAMLALAVALGGSALGFLFFNRHPARLFLGDGGSYFLGFLLGLGTLRAVQADAIGVMPLGVLGLLWGYPIVDTLWAIIRRVKGKRPIFQPDRAHLHHRLLGAIGRYRATVWLLYLLLLGSALLAVVVWALGR